MNQPEPLWGKYRGVVENSLDPLHIGRLMVSLVDAHGKIPLSSWAWPCLPLSGIQSGIFTVPQPGAGVWIEFEKGDRNQPIWVGGYWHNSGELPLMAQQTPPPLGAITLQTATGAGLHISDNPALGIMIRNQAGATILINATGITISNGQGSTIVMAGKIIDMNQTALTVGP
jgi:uncharacterized protein involved in type VI secretion and phage assembly